MTDPIWRLRIFGEPGLEGPAGPVAVRTQRQLGVLLYLALEGPSARRDKVVPLFWPGVPEQKGRHSLTQAMSDLRRTMPGLVQVDRTHVSVCGAQTDLAYLTEDPWSIERGDILAGMDALGGMDLAQWLDAARERVRRTAVRELESMLHRFEAQERVRLARAMLRLDPACETAAIAVAEEALDRGQVTEAARYLQAHQNHIKAELGFDPQLRVASLLKRLERGDLARARAAILGESLQLRAPETVIVGRDAELEVLAEGWRDAAAGRGRTIRLSGAAGIGKSALVRHFLATLAGRGHAAFFVTCHQATRSVPFALVADLTDAISGDSGFAGSDPQWLAELSRIHPVLRRQFPGIPVPEPAPPESIRERLTESLTVILETIADGNPIALAIDDADQADQASLSVLHLVRRRTKRHAVLTLLTSADAGRPAEEHALESDRHLLLQPIQRSAIMELLRSRVPEDGDAGVLERIADIAGGNPLYALTLLGDQSLRQSVAREGLYTSTWTPPRDLLDAVSRAVVQHSTLARRVLSALAVAGTPSTVNLVSEVAGLSEADVRAAAVELLANDRIR
ncbi:MAG: AAA family ATPase, partial [Gemmatimonadales bacterium]